MQDRSQHVDPDGGVEPPVSLAAAEGESGTSHSSQLLERLRKHVQESSRYKLQGEIARGGMGAILKIWDEDLRRNLAMKVILGKAEASSGGGSPPVDSRLLARFLEEAQVTGQLDHPGIVPVHELGLDSTGRVYFTMKLVKGRDLKEVLELVFAEREGWNETRALGVILKVCESLAYAHTKGVVHRDLKPANVMVGSFGEVYVMDWGLARVLGRRDAHDLRLAPEHATVSIRTERRQERDDTPDAPLLTLDGDVVGTPSYMPPEQARGEIEQLSKRSDVFSIGAILYHLLTRQAPYCPPGAKVSNHAVLGMVLHGPPPGVEEIRRDAPAELVAICEKAMARDANARYASTLELAEDLQAYIDGRVVRAHETGAWVEAKKWVKRNKPLAASLAAAVVLLVAGLATSLAFKSRADQKAADLTAANTTIGQRNAELQESTRVARRNLYVSTLSGAQSAMRLNEYATVRRLLASAPEELRGWEWGYLNAAVDTSLLALAGDVAAFSPDGTRIVTALEKENDVRIFDASTGKELVRLEGHTGAVYAVDFSPDGTRVLTGSGDKTARLWDATTGKELARLEGHTRAVSSAVFTPDGARIATACWDEFLRVWDARTGKELSRIPSRGGYVGRDSFSPDGARLVVTSESIASVLDTVTGKELMRLEGHQARVWYANFSPDGTRIATTSDDKTARVWDAATGNEIARIEAWAGSGTVGFSPDSTRLLTVTTQGQATVSDAANGKHLLRLDVGTRSVVTAAFSPDGSSIVTTMEDNTASLWDAATGGELTRYEGLSRRSPAAIFGPDGSRFLTTPSDESVVRVWDAAMDGAHTKLAGHGSALWSAAFSPDGARVATASWDKTSVLWDVATGKEVAQLVGHTGNVGFASFSRDGARLATSSVDGTTRVWEAATTRELARFEAETHRYYLVEFSPDGKRILAWSENQETPFVSDATTGETLVRFEGHAGTAWAAAFSSDGTRVVTGASDKTARVWDAATGKQLARMEGHTSGMPGVAFSPDGTRVATASFDHSARVWDAATGKELARLEGHTQAVRTAAFSPDGTRVVTASEDHTARVWDAATGQELVRLDGHKRGVSSAAFSPDGTRIVTTSFDKTARLWDSVPYRERYAERRSLASARTVAERVVNEILAGPGSFAEAEARIRKDPALDATTRRVALDVLLERCSRAHGQVIALESKRAERTWISRMLGLEPWPSESDAETALRAKGKSLPAAGSEKRSGWRKLVVDAAADDDVQTLLLARRDLASAEKNEIGEFRSRFARALFRLGRFDEALTEQRNAIAETQIEARSSLQQDLQKLESDIAAWRDENGQLRRTEWTDRSATLTREIAVLEQDPDVRLWLDKAR